MKLFGGLDTVALKQHFGKKIMELEDEKRTVQVKYTIFSLYMSLIVEKLRCNVCLFSWMLSAARERSLIG